MPVHRQFPGGEPDPCLVADGLEDTLDTVH